MKQASKKTAFKRKSQICVSEQKLSFEEKNVCYYFIWNDLLIIQSFILKKPVIFLFEVVLYNKI